MIVSCGDGDDREQVGEFLDDFVGGGNEEGRVRFVAFRVEDEKASGALADPLHQTSVVGAAQQCFDTVERIGAAAAGGNVGWLGPFVNHRQRETEVGRNLLGAALLENLAQDFV